MSYFDKYYWSLINNHQPFLRLEDGREDLVLLEDEGRLILDTIDFNQSFESYLNRVEADGGIVGDIVTTNNRFQFLEDEGIYSNILVGLSKDAGNTITTSLVDKAYNFNLSTYNADFTASGVNRPTKNYDFDGVNDVLRGTLQSNSTLDNYTVFSWFFKTGIIGSTNSFRIILRNGATSQFGSGIQIEDGNVGFLLSGSGGVLANFKTSTTISDNTSYLAVYNSLLGNVRVYKNGVLDSTLLVSYTNLNFRNAFRFGGGVQLIDGQITDLYAISSDLSAKAVAIHNNL